MKRKRLWARAHPRPAPPLEEQRRQRDHIIEAGQQLSTNTSIFWGTTPELAWLIRIAIPFRYAASKNHLYAMRSLGHRALRRESRDMRDEITLAFKTALSSSPVHIRQNKIWIDIFVEKPNHKGDAINVVDLVCDGIRNALPVDDRWFSIRRLDWAIAKNNPRLFIGIGQEEVENVQACSTCGHLLDFACFSHHKHNLNGIDRTCKECRKLGRKLAKAQER
jgi:hypothetical protein